MELTEKEKAKELYLSFYHIGFTDKEYSKEIAMKSALICVDEIIKSISPRTPFGQMKLQYWRIVKIEINNYGK